MTRALLLAAACGVALASCRREDRDYRPAAPFAEGVRYAQDFEQNAFALSEGKRLFQAMNCNGCHGYGSGAIGPPLMDDKWVYGYEPEQVFDTIARGRPNGMPAFRGEAREPGITVVGTLPDYQIWQLVAYVRSLSGQAPGDAAPGRSDHMSGPPTEQNRARESPVVAPPPDAGDQPK
ncbi:c-type cytochrome [Gemmata sp.]|uniref:c-type cytochrome n=1 Tax=Gemmata sp. TaxID=1914242 RepID=UPI003F72D718